MALVLLLDQFDTRLRSHQEVSRILRQPVLGRIPRFPPGTGEPTEMMVAISDPQQTGDQEATLRVEYIYQDRNEAQLMYLEKGAAGWKITRADGDERVKTMIPYGTPVK